MGPGGMPTYRIVTTQEASNTAGRLNYSTTTTPVEEVQLHTTCTDCFMCGVNGLLAFRPFLFDDTQHKGYVMPASRSVKVQARGESEPTLHLLPTPFCAMIVPFNHSRATAPVNVSDDTRFELGVSTHWTGQVQHLLRLVPDLLPGQPFSFHHQFGHEAGARPQGWEKNADADRWEPHGFTRVTYGRDRLPELDSGMSPDWLVDALTAHPCSTANLGLDMILHLSRVAAGSLPSDDQVLWDMWEQVAGQPTDIEQYHRAVVAFGA